MPASTAQFFDYAKLLSLREAADLTREQVGAGAGISVSHLCALETGTRTPRIPVLIRLADFYGCDPGELLTGWGGRRRAS